MPPMARWLSRLIWRSRRLKARTTSAIGGMMTKVMSVSFQFAKSSTARSAAIVTVSRTKTVRTPVDASASWETSLVKRATSFAVAISSKYAGGRRSTLENIARRKSRMTFCATHCIENPETKLAIPLTRKTPTTASGRRIAKSRLRCTKSSSMRGPVTFTSAASARPPTIIAAMPAKRAPR